MLIDRAIASQVKGALTPGKVIMLLGARRVGKTTLIKQVEEGYLNTSCFFNSDDPQVRELLTGISAQQLKQLLKNYDLVIIDEAQRIKNIGFTLKLLVDEIPDKKVLVSGSSSLELSNEITEPLTGRKKTFYLYPLSFLELFEFYHHDRVALTSQLDMAMRYGSYPDVFDQPDHIEKAEYLLELSQDYLYKDALEYQEVRNPEQLRRLLSALALQIGQEVSYTELANIVGVDQKTVIRYIDLLEKSYVIFRLPALSRNLRKEINKSRKIYFFDLGIRNALIRNFNPYDLRNDKGQAWENFLITERIKRDTYSKVFKNYYFWRTYDQKEIDFVEEHGGTLVGYEFKWQKDTFKEPTEFLESYEDSRVELVNKKNYLDFIV
jgi:predicted AAA+ superfamily ATPase